jgi:inner membrane protein
VIIGHLPAGYLVAKTLADRLVAGGRSTAIFVCAALLGSIFPDIDWLYFFWVDHQRHHHHTYWTHYPMVWAALTLGCAVWMRLCKDSVLAPLGFIFALNGFVHLLLDTFTGPVWWLAPFVDEPFSLFIVGRTHELWWLNFVLNWSFLLETALLAAAVIVYVRDRQRRHRVLGRLLIPPS